jgi:signal peptide peptidase SppA
MSMIHVGARVFNTPLLVHPAKAAAILWGLGSRIAGNAVEVSNPQPLPTPLNRGRGEMGVIGDRLGRSFDRMGKKPYDMVGNIAVIPIEGTLVHKGSWVESDSGETSYQGLQTQVQRAARDEAVKGVVFEIDSFGGEVAGAFETSDMIAELSLAKPTLAILTDHAYSAGYLMASAARSIVIPETGGAGSIGVITLHADYSAALAQRGIKVTILKAGAHKADGNPYEPLAPEVAERITGQLEEARKAFAERVSRYRGKRLSFDAAMATEALDYTGAEAVRMGLADATGHPLQTFQAFQTKLNRA